MPKLSKEEICDFLFSEYDFLIIGNNTSRQSFAYDRGDLMFALSNGMKLKDLHIKNVEDFRLRSMEPKEKDETKKAKNIQSGHIYIIRSGEIYKIGKTKNIKNRMKSYRTHNPDFHLVKIIKCDDIDAKEASLHNLYAEKKYKDEWFHLSDDDIKNIV